MGKEVIELVLPYPPSANRYYRHVGYRTLISREGRRYRQSVCALVRPLGIPCLGGPLELAIDVYPPDRRRRDLDNTEKSLIDSLQHAGLYQDDSQIDKITITRRKPTPGGRVIITLGGYGGEQ